MTLKMDTLLKEAKESIEAAQNYRSELQLRLHGLSQARTQVHWSVSRPSVWWFLFCVIFNW